MSSCGRWGPAAPVVHTDNTGWRVGGALKVPLLRDIRAKDGLSPIQKSCPPPRHNLLFQVVLAADMRHAPAAGQQVENHLRFELRSERTPSCHHGLSRIRTDCTPLWDLSSRRALPQLSCSGTAALGNVPHPLAEQIQLRAPIALPFQACQFRDLALDLSVTVGQRQSGLQRRLLAL